MTKLYSYNRNSLFRNWRNNSRPVGEEILEAVDNLKNAELIVGHNVIF